MKKYLLISLAGFIYTIGVAQQKYFDFESAVPSNVSSTGSPLSLSNEHLKDGGTSLKWAVKNGTTLILNHLNISATDIDNRNTGVAQFFIYSRNITNDTMVFRFYDKSDKLQREGHMVLNYAGWRDYRRSYKFDYNNKKELPGFALEKMEIIYKPANPAATSILYLDAFTMTGAVGERAPGPHMQLDKQHLMGQVDMLDDYLHAPNMQVTPATEQELNDAKKVNAFYLRKIPSVNAEDLIAAKRFVENCNIHRNADGSITGRGLRSLDQEDSMVQLSTYCGYLAQAAIHQSDNEAKTDLILFTEYLLDQGLAEGGPLFLHLGHYGQSLKFPTGFLQAMSLYPEELKKEVVKMLKWHVGYNRIYKNTEADPNTDYMHLRSDFLFELAALDASANESVRDLKCISRYMGLFAQTTQGSVNGIKPDGVAFHHNAFYLGYMYAMGTYAERLYSLKGTVYRISAEAFKNIAFFYKSAFLQSSGGVIYANAASGRNPFSGFPISADKLAKMVEVGGDIKSMTYDPELASLYNYVFSSHKYPVAAQNFDGYYQYNYGQLGVQRKDNWVAVMRGFTNRLWGTEIYVNQNRYGRYQSYGSLEVMYNGDTTASGYPSRGGNGWDWNMAPGTTTVHLPFAELQAKQGRADEYNQNSFAGALSLGSNGIFAIDFIEKAGNKYTPNNLKFHKSVFSFSNIFVCLGSGISSTNATDTTATNLFQAVSGSSNPSVYVNSNHAISTDNYQQLFSTTSEGVWLVNGQTTGFYVPKNGGNIVVERGTQATPMDRSLTGLPVVAGNFSKAYITHGTSPSNTSYRFVVVPGTDPKQMSKLANNMAGDKIFAVLSQTDSLHAVKYIPDNVTGYAFFEANEKVNIGYIKSISGKALVGVKEKGDTLIVTINNPDLNAVDDSLIGWRSTVYQVSLSLNGAWKVVDNSSNAAISNNGNDMNAGFSLKDGFAASLVLIRDRDKSNAKK
jgi:hypothetical protein